MGAGTCIVHVNRHLYHERNQRFSLISSSMNELDRPVFPCDSSAMGGKVVTSMWCYCDRLTFEKSSA